jgi:tRNA A-37 threonylcarbamoyl transferase component Bud32
VADIISHAAAGADFDIDQLRGVAPIRRIEGRNWTKADVEFYEIDGLRVAVKTYAPRNTLARNTLGRWLIRREAAAFRAVAGIEAVPEFFGRIGPFAIATRWVDAVPLKEHAGGRLDEDIFDRLGAIVDEFHERGVALADLHHRDVLLADDGTLYVLDLATGWVAGDRPGPLRRYLFERFCESDRVNLARMRARFTGEDVEAAVASVSPAAAAWHRRGRKVKTILNRLRGKRTF